MGKKYWHKCPGCNGKGVVDPIRHVQLLLKLKRQRCMKGYNSAGTPSVIKIDAWASTKTTGGR